jgi:hypothetical protein
MMTMKKNKLRGVVPDDTNDYTCVRRKKTDCRTKLNPKEKRKNESTDIELDTLLKNQRIKDKQLLKEWKAAQQEKKKTNTIMRRQARDFHAKVNQYLEAGVCCSWGITDTYYLWKHEGCNDACKAEDCITWLIESDY